MNKCTTLPQQTQLIFPAQIGEVKLIYKKASQQKQPQKIMSSRDAADIFFNHWDTDTIEYFEAFKVMLLDKGNKVLGIYKVSEGGTSSCLVDVRKIFQSALLANSSSIIAAHNHPSGNTAPSESDKAITNKLKEAGAALDIPLLDHVVITADGDYLSFADDGLL